MADHDPHRPPHAADDASSAADCDGGDPDAAAILARRQRFVAGALASLALASRARPAPAPCLSAPRPHRRSR